MGGASKSGTDVGWASTQETEALTPHELFALSLHQALDLKDKCYIRL
jgi:hypothetical protein